MKVRNTMGSNSKVNCLGYGLPGVGKTVLCSTAPNPLILSAESGLLSLAKFKLPYIEIETLQDLHDAYSFVTESKECKQYETICLDSISEIAEILLAEYKSECKDPRQAYGMLSESVTKIIRAFRDIKNKHVYFAAKETRVIDAHTGITSYQALMPGKQLQNSIMFHFDEVFCVKVGEKEVDEEDISYRYLQCQPDMSYNAKDRSGNLKLEEPPNLAKLFDKCLSRKKSKRRKKSNIKIETGDS